MGKRRSNAFVLPLAAVMAVAALAGHGVASAALRADGTPRVNFHATGPAGLKIEGVGSELQLRDESGQITVVVPLGNMTTGITLRDKHMREKYLETAAYPTAELTLRRADLSLPAAGSASGTAKGTMKIHGKTNPVLVRYRVNRDATGYAVTGETDVDMRAYGITVPSYLGVTVKPEVLLDVSFHAADS